MRLAQREGRLADTEPSMRASEETRLRQEELNAAEETRFGHAQELGMRRFSKLTQRGAMSSPSLADYTAKSTQSITDDTAVLGDFVTASGSESANPIHDQVQEGSSDKHTSDASRHREGMPLGAIAKPPGGDLACCCKFLPRKKSRIRYKNACRNFTPAGLGGRYLLEKGAQNALCHSDARESFTRLALGEDSIAVANLHPGNPRSR